MEYSLIFKLRFCLVLCIKIKNEKKNIYLTDKIYIFTIENIFVKRECIVVENWSHNSEFEQNTIKWIYHHNVVGNDI